MNVSALRLIAFSSASQRLGPSLKFEGVLQQIVLARQCNCSQEVRKGGPAIHLYACFVGSLVVFFEHSKRSNSGYIILRSLVLYHVSMHRCSSSSILGSSETNPSVYCKKIGAKRPGSRTAVTHQIHYKTWWHLEHG